MINYSLVMRENPYDRGGRKKAYATAQYAELMDINQFAEHISSHGCVYNRADIVAILTLAVDCMRELLLAGKKISMGDLGSFYASLSSNGAPDPKCFNPAIYIKKVNVNWDRGALFKGLLEEATFKEVPIRSIQAKLMKAMKNGDDSMNLGPEEEPGEEGIETI